MAKGQARFSAIATPWDATPWDVIRANALAFSKHWEGAGYANQDAIAQVDVNIKAAGKMANLHDALLEVLKSIHKQQRGLDISLLVNVNVGQFYGIEIEDFPCQIAQVGMWLVCGEMR